MASFSQILQIQFLFRWQIEHESIKSGKVLSGSEAKLTLRLVHRLVFQTLYALFQSVPRHLKCQKKMKNVPLSLRMIYL